MLREVKGQAQGHTAIGRRPNIHFEYELTYRLIYPGEAGTFGPQRAGEAQRRQVTCPRPHSYKLAEPMFGFKAHVATREKWELNRKDLSLIIIII